MVQNGSPFPASEVSVLNFEGDSIKLVIIAKRHRRKPIDPEASQFEDSMTFDEVQSLVCAQSAESLSITNAHRIKLEQTVIPPQKIPLISRTEPYLFGLRQLRFSRKVTIVGNFDV